MNSLRVSMMAKTDQDKQAGIILQLVEWTLYCIGNIELHLIWNNSVYHDILGFYKGSIKDVLKLVLVILLLIQWTSDFGE